MNQTIQAVVDLLAGMLWLIVASALAMAILMTGSNGNPTTLANALGLWICASTASIWMMPTKKLSLSGMAVGVLQGIAVTMIPITLFAIGLSAQNVVLYSGILCVAWFILSWLTDILIIHLFASENQILREKGEVKAP